MNAFKSMISDQDEIYIEEAFKKLEIHYKNYKDPWGFDLETCKKALKFLLPLYRQYFRVRVFGAEKIPDKPLIVVSNHTGQIPIDGILVGMAFFMDSPNPRILRAMVERFMVQLPFLADFSAKAGAILGDRANCQYLLEKGESILVFPEGVRGIAKNTSHFYEVQSFTQGFYRIALQKHTDILPIAVVGAEEMFPYVHHLRGIAKKLSLPALPLSLNLWPLPVPIDIYIGDPISVPTDLSAEAPDKELKEPIYKIEEEIKRMITTGLENKRSTFPKVDVASFLHIFQGLTK